MFTTDLKKFLSDVYTNKETMKTILIEGKWGCGKTYAIKNFVGDEKERVNYLYLSLFGLSNSNDITMRLAEKLDSSFIINSGDSFIVKPSVKEDDYNNSIVIFDDLERKSKSLTFSSIYGIVNSLQMLGFKVICVVCEEKGLIDEEDYSLFREKTFDAIIHVGANPDVCEELIGDGIKISQSLMRSAKDNFRSVLRAKKRYDSIISKAKEKGFDNIFPKLDVSETVFFEHIVLAERCFFSSNDSDPVFNEKEFLRKMFYEEDVKAFGRLVANELAVLKSEETSLTIDKIRDLLLLFETFDYDGFFSNYFVAENDELFVKAPLLKAEPFLLSDEDKAEYAREFYANVKKLDLNDSKYQRIITSFVSTLIKNTNQTRKNYLLNIIAENASFSSGNEIAEKLKMMRGDNPEILSFSNDLERELDKRKKEEVKSLISHAFKETDYKKMIELLNENKYSSQQEKENVLELLQGHGFGLPDLSKTISHDAWSYCHQMAKYVSGTSYEKMFIKSLEAQCILNEKSFAVRDKCNALAKYNLSGQYEDFLVKYPVKSKRITPKDLLKKK